MCCRCSNHLSTSLDTTSGKGAFFHIRTVLLVRLFHQGLVRMDQHSSNNERARHIPVILIASGTRAHWQPSLSTLKHFYLLMPPCVRTSVDLSHVCMILSYLFEFPRILNGLNCNVLQYPDSLHPFSIACVTTKLQDKNQNPPLAKLI